MEGATAGGVRDPVDCEGENEEGGKVESFVIYI